MPATLDTPLVIFVGVMGAVTLLALVVCRLRARAAASAEEAEPAVADTEADYEKKLASVQRKAMEDPQQAAQALRRWINRDEVVNAPILNNLSGTERAAALLMALGESVAAEVMKHLGPKALRRIGEAMAHTHTLEKALLHGVVHRFLEESDLAVPQTMDGARYLRRTLTAAVGEGRGQSLTDPILRRRSSRGLDALRWTEPRVIAEMMRLEHPQVVALVVAHLEGEEAAQVLTLLPEGLRAEVVMRVAAVDGVQPEALRELDAIIAEQLAAADNIKVSSVGGPTAAADILNHMDFGRESGVMETIRRQDPKLAEEIEEGKLQFETLAQVDDRSMQALLRELSSKTLIVALKGADERFKAKVFRNLSRRAAAVLRDDMELHPPVRGREVEASQKEILAVARRMAEAGDLSLTGGDYV